MVWFLDSMLIWEIRVLIELFILFFKEVIMEPLIRVKNILYLFNECSPQTPLSGWKSTLSRYLQSNGKTDHKDEMDYEMTANKFFIY